MARRYVHSEPTSRLAVWSLRIAGFAVCSLVARESWAVALAYLIPMLGFLGGLAFAMGPSLSTLRLRTPSRRGPAPAAA